MFVPRPFLKLGVSCASALLLVTVNASAHDSKGSDSQSFRISDSGFFFSSDSRHVKTFDSDDFFKFDQRGFGGDGSSNWGNTDDSSKSSKRDGKVQFSFRDQDCGHFEFSDSRHDDKGRGDDSWGNDGGWGNGNDGSGSFCGGGDNNGCGGKPTCGGDPSSTPEPGSSFLSVIAAGLMGLLLVGRNVQRRNRS